MLSTMLSVGQSVSSATRSSVASVDFFSFFRA